MIHCPTCTHDQQRVWLQTNSGLEGDLLDARIGNWKRTQFKQPAQNEQRDQTKSLMLDAIESQTGFYTFYGDFGSGKTRALATVCNELRAQMIETYYVPMASIMNHLRALIGQKSDNSVYLDRLLNIPVLALDEVTRFHTTPWAQEKLFVLADTRYRRRESHLTLFATNDDPTSPVPVDEALGYLLSRMNQGKVSRMQGDVRPALRG